MPARVAGIVASAGVASASEQPAAERQGPSRRSRREAQSEAESTVPLRASDASLTIARLALAAGAARRQPQW